MLLCSKAACVATQNIVERLVPPKRIRRGPIIRPEHPWEARGVYFQGTVLKDGGTYRMWYSAIGERGREQQYCAYAESRDGVHFEKPLRKESAHLDWPATNIVYGTRFNISAPGVQLYDSPRDGYRYVMAFDSRIEQHAFQFVPKVGGLHPADKRRLMRHPNYTPDYDWSKYYPNTNQTYRATYFADSPDGLNWEPEDARFGIPGASDGDHCLVWDASRRLYRLYFRGNRVDENGRRIRQVLTASSPDTVEWYAPQLCMESDAIDDPRVNQVHGLTVTPVQGAFIGLVQVMEIEEDVVRWDPLQPFERARFHVQLAYSEDGVHFHRVGERAEYFGTGEEGCFDAGMVRSGGHWVFDGDRMLMYYDGRPYRHARKPGEARRHAEGCSDEVGIGVAASPRDRFAGLTPMDRSRPGRLVVALPEGASGLALNCHVATGARILCSLRRPDGCRILTHQEENCLPVREGGLRVPLLWKGAEALLQDAGPVHLRITLEGDAAVYALYAES